jgi:hypothetical protein
MRAILAKRMAVRSNSLFGRSDPGREPVIWLPKEALRRQERLAPRER